VCASADNSCLMHIGGALSRQRAGVRTMHIAEILAQTDETDETDEADVTEASRP